MDTSIFEWISAALLVIGVVFVLWHNWEGHLTSNLLGRMFFWFGIICGLFGIFTQYGDTGGLGSQILFGDATFYFSLGSLAILAAIYWNTDKSNRLL